MASTSGEALPLSPLETLSMNKSTKTKRKSNFSLRSLWRSICASIFKPAENTIHRDASSNATTNNDDRHGGAAFSTVPKLMHDELVSMDKACKETKEYMDRVSEKISAARKKLEELQNSGSSERDFEQLRKAIAKLKLQIPTQVNIFDNEDHYGGEALSPSSKLMHDDLLLVDSTFVDTKEYMDHMSLKINQAHTKFREIQESRCNPEREYDDTSPKNELRKAIKKLKVQIPWHAQIPWHVKLRSADSNRDPHQRPHISVAPYQWPNINGAKDEMTHFLYKEPSVEYTSDYDMLFQAFRELPLVLQQCLLCFFKFPPEAIIQRTTMIYLWIGQGYAEKFSGGRDTNENAGNKIFNVLVEKGFIQPINRNCSLVPDSCKMSLFVRSALYERAEYEGFSSNDNLDLVPIVDEDYKDGRSCLINVGEAIINWESKIIGNADKIKCLYLGRWQRSVEHHQSVEHHIEVRDPEILLELKNLKILKFLSLRGISMITELPKCILELKHLNILDIRACYNLEAIPDNIGLLKNLTHLDMSECYFLDHMPESLALLSNLEVLKGFLIGDFNKKKQSCTLSDLSRLRKLRKLNIYIGVKHFQQRWDFDDLKKFEVLQKLAISWGGCSFQGENCTQIQDKVGEENSTPTKENGGEENCTPIQFKKWLEKFKNCTSIQEVVGEEKVGEIQQEIGEENCIPIQEKVGEENYTPIQEKVGEENRTLIQENVGEIQEEGGEENCTPIQEKVGEENCSLVQGKVGEIQEEVVGEENQTPIQCMLIKGKVGEIQEEVVGEENYAPIQGKVGEIEEEVGEENYIPIQEIVEENCKPIQGKVSEESGILPALLTKGSLELPRKLQKLDLQGFPAKCLTDWLTPSKVQGLLKLYIRGGQLYDIGQNLKGEKWNVNTLRLKYLSELKIDWSELRILFPKLICLHQDGCFKLTSFQCDERGVWNKAGTDSHMQL